MKGLSVLGMMMVTLGSFAIAFSASAGQRPASTIKPAPSAAQALSKEQADATPINEEKMLELFAQNYNTKQELVELQNKTLAQAGKAVPALIKVMKESKYPDKNRWMATFLVGRIMGKKAGPFISKFLKHPNWVLRMASLKTLLALREEQYGSLFAGALKDKSLIVRTQALENIHRLDLKEHAANVWEMLYDKRNYYSEKEGERTNIIRKVITVVGDLRFDKAKDPLLKMIQKEKYQDIFGELDYSLGKITGKKSPEGEKAKKFFWNRVAMADTVI